MSKKKRALEKWELFCLEYMKDGNGSQSAIRAGYSKKTADQTASRLLRYVKVIKRLEELREERKKDSEITEEYLLNNLKEVSERCMQRIPVTEWDKDKKEYVQVTDEEGKGVWTFQPMAVIKANELLMKHKGMLVEKIQHSGEVKSIVDLVKHASKK